MSADPQGRARLLGDVLAGSALAAWREQLRRDCLARLAAVPTGRALLLRDVFQDARHVGFQARLRDTAVARLRRRPRTLTRAAWAAALLLAVLGSWLAARPADRPGSGAPVAVAPAPPARPRWELRTRPVAAAVQSPGRLDLAAPTGSRLRVVATRPLAERLRLRDARPRADLDVTAPATLEQLDDVGLLALLTDRPSALVETGPGTKRLVLIDPEDEAALVAGGSDEPPR